MFKIPYNKVLSALLFSFVCTMSWAQKVITYNNKTFEIPSELLESNADIILDYRKQFTVNQDESALESTYLLAYPLVFYKSSFKDLMYSFSKDNPLTDVTITVFDLTSNAAKIYKLEDFTTSYVNTLFNEQKASLSVRKPSDDFLIEIAVVQQFKTVWPYYSYHSSPIESVPTLKSKFELSGSEQAIHLIHFNGATTSNRIFESNLNDKHTVDIQLKTNSNWQNISTPNELYNVLNSKYLESSTVTCEFIDSVLKISTNKLDYYELYNKLKAGTIQTQLPSNALKVQSFYNALRNNEYNALTSVLLTKKAAECAEKNSFIITKLNSSNQVNLYIPEFAIGIQENEGLFWMNFTTSSTAGFINNELSYKNYTVVINDLQAAPNPIYSNVSKINADFSVEILPLHQQKIQFELSLSGQACLLANELKIRNNKSVLYELFGLQVKDIEGFEISDFTVENGHPKVKLSGVYTTSNFTKLNQGSEVAFLGAINLSNTVSSILPSISDRNNLELSTNLTIISKEAKATLADLSAFNLTTDFGSVQVSEVNNLVKVNYNVQLTPTEYTSSNFKTWWGTLSKIYIAYK